MNLLNWQTQLRKGLLELAILNMLSKDACHGYQMVQVLKQKGVAVGHLLFEGEGHGFRTAQNIKRALEAELHFYGRVLGFEPADSIEPVEIFNLAPDTVC